MPIETTPDERLDYIQKVLAATKNRNTRFDTAMKRRLLLAGYVASNEMPPPGPALNRLEFIKGGAEKVIHLLGSLGEAFNATYGDDIATVPDLADILSTALANLRAKTA
jgi:hypothetical protein